MTVIIKVAIASGVVGVIAIILGAVLGFAVLPDVVDSEIEKNTVLALSDQYRRWQKLPFPLTFKVYLFHVNNPDDVLNGSDLPDLTEQGPYIYKQHMEKDEINCDEEHTRCDYKQKYSYEFDEAASAPLKETDSITILNVAKYGAFMEVSKMGDSIASLANSAANGAFTDTKDHLFHNIQVGDYLFNGYTFCEGPNLLCNILRIRAEEIPAMILNDDGSISFQFFKHKEIPDGPYNIDMGTTDINKLGQIYKYKGESELNNWSGDCNKILGTDATIYPPYSDEETILDVFSNDICRSVKLEFSETVEYKDITGHRSFIKQNTFASGDTFPDNACYCFNDTDTRTLFGDRCFPDGFLDLYTCQHSAIVASLPHFLWANKKYSSTVRGLSPNVEKHAIFVDLEPATGSPLRGAKRIQFNMMLRKINNLTPTLKLNETALPIIWVEEGTELPDNLVEKLKDEYVSKIPLVEGVKWGFMAVGLALLVLSIGIALMCRKKK